MKRRLHLMYGGTFDPFHRGHLHIAEWARDHAQAEVFITPAADPPHRASTAASATQRMQMVELGIAGRPRLHADDRELRRKGPSYTVDTLHALRDELGEQAPLGILLGSDSFLSLPSWHRWRELLALAHIVVADRPGNNTLADMPEALAQQLEGRLRREASALCAQPHGRVLHLRQPELNISATQIRAEIAAGGEAWPALLEPAVAEYITANGLYRSSKSAARGIN